jgi:hypothetical protein
MRYTNYVILNAILILIVFVIFAGAIFSIGGPAAVGVIIVLGLILLLGFGMSVAWAHRAVTEFNGSPFPGIWGVLGFDIEPDDEDSPPYGTVSSGLPSDQFGSMSSGYSSGLIPTPRAVATGARKVTALGCAKCGAVTEGGDSRFCRMCGASLTG